MATVLTDPYRLYADQVRGGVLERRQQVHTDSQRNRLQRPALRKSQFI